MAGLTELTGELCVLTTSQGSAVGNREPRPSGGIHRKHDVARTVLLKQPLTGFWGARASLQSFISELSLL